jgi:predicted metal-binding membrane protein
MMLPGAAPAILKRAYASGRVCAVPLFVGSYFGVWALLGSAVYALYRPHGTFAAGARTIAAVPTSSRRSSSTSACACHDKKENNDRSQDRDT